MSVCQVLVPELQLSNFDAVYFRDLKSRSLGYFSWRWLAVYGYLLVVLIATPYLPSLIQWACLRWPAELISAFVLGVAISIGILLIVSAGAVFFLNPRKLFLFILIIGGLIAFAGLFYLIIPNPYELTHLPEYAILGILVIQAAKGGKAKNKDNMHETYLYFQSAILIGALGAIDELYQGFLPSRYFIWYDVLLNGIGGLLGLTVFWGLNRK